MSIFIINDVIIQVKNNKQVIYWAFYLNIYYFAGKSWYLRKGKQFLRHIEHHNMKRMIRTRSRVAIYVRSTSTQKK